jgi:replicative DNA helicase
MTAAKPGRHTRRDWLRPVPEHKPPHNLEAEEAVLGAILAASRLLPEVAALVEEVDFYRPAHRAIWRAVLRLADRGQPTDPVTVLGELDDSGELADVGGGPFLQAVLLQLGG